MRERTLQPSFVDERRIAKNELIIAGWVGRVGMPSKAFEPTNADSQGQVSSNKLSYEI